MEYLKLRRVMDNNLRGDLSKLRSDTFNMIIGYTLGDTPSVFVETIYLALDVKSSISNKIFADKLIAFLYGVSETSLSDRVSFLDKFINESEDEFYSKLCLLIDGVNDLDCAVITGRLMRALIFEKITHNEFMYSIHSVRNSISETLKVLKNCTNDGRYPLTSEYLMLISAGLMYVNNSIWFDTEDDIRCQLTGVGALVIKYGLEELW